MAGRAATAVKSPSKPKPRLGAKASAQVSVPKAKAESKVKAGPNIQAGTDEATAAAVPAKPRRRAKVETRTRIYWAVFNQDCKRVAVFEFDQKAEAEKRAAKLISSSGEHHFIQKIKASVPV